jgi:GNAT superfamily N-acetyltransferase
MAVTIREYGPADYEDCCALWGELSQHHADIYSEPSIAAGDLRQYFDEYLNRVDRFGTWVAEDSGRVVRLTGLLSNKEQVREGEIEPLVISAGMWNRGIGTKLIEYIIERARENGIRYLGIRPVARNREAIMLYSRLGFNILGHLDMVRDLAPDDDREWIRGINVHGGDFYY